MPDCSDLLKSGHTQSGVHSINPDGTGHFSVYCDMRTDGGGWTVFQRRQDGSVDFYRGWDDYKAGFGQLTAEFWLGNDKIYRLTASRPSSLRVEIEDWNGGKAYTKYGKFKIGDEQAQYRLEVGSYSGTAGDSLTYHNNMRFLQKTEIMTDLAVTVLYQFLAPGGSTVATTPISTENTWETQLVSKVSFGGAGRMRMSHSNLLK